MFKDSINQVDSLYLSDNAILWLSELLSERFGHNVIIRPYDDYSYELYIYGSNKSVIIDSLNSDFIQPEAKIGFSYWTPEVEGLTSILKLPIPAPGYSVLNKPLVEIRKNKNVLHYDLFGLIYWCLTRVEEYNDVELDIHGRYPVYHSHAKLHNYLDRPIVDEWLEVLKQLILQNDNKLVFKKNNYSLILSHDVDRPFLYLELKIFNIIKIIIKKFKKKLDLRNAIKSFYSWYLVNYNKNFLYDPFYTFDYIMNVAKSRGISCTFYFLCGSTNEEFDADYKIDDEIILNLLQKLDNNGHKIGVHPSYDSFLDSSKIKDEIEMFISICKTYNLTLTSVESRMHYLRYDVRTTMNYLSQCGVKNDSTLNYANESGFRCGTCFDYVYFDHGLQKNLGIIERPLIVMDNNFIDEIDELNYLHILNNINELKQRCKSVGGNFTVLWHNSELYNNFLKKIFLDIIS